MEENQSGGEGLEGESHDKIGVRPNIRGEESRRHDHGWRVLPGIVGLIGVKQQSPTCGTTKPTAMILCHIPVACYCSTRYHT